MPGIPQDPTRVLLAHSQQSPLANQSDLWPIFGIDCRHIENILHNDGEYFEDIRG